MKKVMMTVLAGLIGMSVTSASQAAWLHCSVGDRAMKAELNQKGAARIDETVTVSGNNPYEIYASVSRGKVSMVTLKNVQSGVQASAYALEESLTLQAGLTEAGAQEVTANCSVLNY
jgi:hypothetical protein